MSIVAPTHKKIWNQNIKCWRRHVSYVWCHMLRVSCHLSLTASTTAMERLPTNSPTMHSRMVHKDPQIYFFLRYIRPILQILRLTSFHDFFLRCRWKCSICFLTLVNGSIKTFCNIYHIKYSNRHCNLLKEWAWGRFG